MLTEGAKCKSCEANEQTCAFRGGCCRLCTHTFGEHRDDIPVERTCSQCSNTFLTASGPGRPRSRCDRCTDRPTAAPGRVLPLPATAHRADSGDGYREVPINSVHPHPDNVRRELEDIGAMAESMISCGVIQPLVTIPRELGGLTVIAGHRRLAAAKLAGLRDVPVVIRRDLSANDVIRAMLVENLHRFDLKPIEEARAMQRLVDAGMVQEEIAKKIGRSSWYVSRRLLLNQLPDEVRGRLTAKEITITEATNLALQLQGRPPGEVDRGWAKPWFTAEHRLATIASDLCDHSLRRRLGPACGECWEQAIRDDAIAPHVDLPVETPAVAV